ncbi:hypothetical protein GCM10010193_01030 [Kitasatospora atroaurantiaca]|uniref:Putative lipoprotein with Yx(FWY)xxD motif n=1 Tax=Kitasatospora atroaurantiaca TaxID=285545 RepID=A0A561EL31_9ACTN|nr:hypothetical protein [Kitasatospora atroaurantiaca]TWE16326.1 putative lipoprotein with Yx(FWY)xxD motif [Kitasatospora atroaurantiaca]
MPTLRRAAVLAAAGTAVAALVTGCGSSGSSYSPGSATTPASPSAPASPTSPASPSAPASPAEKAALQTATAGSLGTVVTDGNGFTLYRFDKDTAKPSMSNCNGNCASLWPPVAPVDKGQVKGVDPALVGTVTRADGSKQLTLNGWPLYRYAPDTKAGDTKGQGVGGTWFASTPDGKKAGAPAPATSPSTGGGGYGY